MIYILLLCLFLLLLISYFIGNHDIFSPWFLSCAMYITSVLFVIFNGNNWNTKISLNTVLVINIALLAFGFGEVFARTILNIKKDIKKIIYSEEKIVISRIVNFIIYCFSVLILILYYFKIRDIAVQVGYLSGQNLLIQYARLGTLTYGISIGPVLAIGTFILRSLSYVYTFIYFYNKFTCRKGKILENIHLFLPTICYLVQYSLGGSRGGIIEYIAYSLCLFAIFQMKTTRNKLVNNIKIFKYATLALFVFFIIFANLGALKGWQIAEIWSWIPIYSGGSILALDEYLNSTHKVNDIFGKESLIGINHILYLLDIYQSDSTRILGFVNTGMGCSINIYTGLRRYIQDFGYMGMIIVQFCFGFIFSAMYLNIKRMKTVSYLYILYSSLFMAIVYQSIDDQFLVFFLSVTQVFTIGFTVLIYNLLCKNKIRDVKYKNYVLLKRRLSW